LISWIARKDWTPRIADTAAETVVAAVARTLACSGPIVRNETASRATVSTANTPVRVIWSLRDSVAAPGPDASSARAAAPPARSLLLRRRQPTNPAAAGGSTTAAITSSGTCHGSTATTHLLT
jgi:hypothetical protein